MDSVVYTVFASDPDEGSSGNFHFVLTDPVRKITVLGENCYDLFRYLRITSLSLDT